MKILVRGDITSPNGCSFVTRSLVGALKDRCDLYLRTFQTLPTQYPMVKMEAEFYKKLTEKTSPEYDVTITVGPFQEMMNLNPKSYNIGWVNPDTILIPSNVMNILGKLDEIFVSSDNGAEVLVNNFGNGHTPTITKMHQPMNTDGIVPDGPELPILGITYNEFNEFIPKEERPLVIGMASRWHVRKNIHEMLMSIFATFKRGECIVLFKTFENQIGRGEDFLLKKKVDDIKAMFDNPPAVTIINESLPDDQYLALFNSMDVYLMTPHFECGGTDLMAASAKNVPIITHDAGSCLEVAPGARAVGCQAIPVTGYGHNTRGNWWYRPNMFEISETLSRYTNLEERAKINTREKFVAQSEMGTVGVKIIEHLEKQLGLPRKRQADHAGVGTS